MSEGARVESIDAIQQFKFAVVKFIEASNAALGDAESDIQRTIVWLESEQESHWNTQIRHRQDALQKALEALRQKQLFKDSTGRAPSAVEEQKIVQQCQKRLAEAQEKLAKVRHHAKRLQKEALLYKGQVQRFATNVSSDLPAAIAHLGALVQALEEYAAMNPAGVGGSLSPSTAASFGDNAGGSMSRGGAEAGEQAAAGAAATHANLRARVPSPADRAAAPEGKKLADKWAAGTVPEPQRAALGELSVNWSPVGENDRVLVAKGAAATEPVFMERRSGAEPGDSGWYVGPVDRSADAAPESFKAADFLAARPDLSQMLTLPGGFLVVVATGGIEAVLDERDENVWKKP